MICRNCKNKSFFEIIKLGNQPISSLFPSKKMYLKKFPLSLYECNRCKLVQLSKIPNLSDMYGENYGYKTSVSNLMVNHLKNKFIRYKNKNYFKKGSNILDIGSNDGTFLNFFINKKKKYNLYAIDPSAENFKNDYSPKINLAIDFFNKDKVLKLLENNKNKKFSLITSFAVFYDIENPNKFCKEINSLLEKDGIWSIEISYFPLLISNLTYDQICHEHVTYYSLSTFNKILKNNGMKVVDYKINEINGGSIEILCAKEKSSHKVKMKKIKELIKEEDKINRSKYKNFELRVNSCKKNLNLIIDGINKKDIYGYGASTKGNVILNYCKINYKKINYICDGNPSKHGKYTPGSYIKIISKELMRKKKPKFLLVLIWSFKKEVIMQELDYIINGGQLIFPLPSIHIVDKYNYKKYLNAKFDIFEYKN